VEEYVWYDMIVTIVWQMENEKSKAKLAKKKGTRDGSQKKGTRDGSQKKGTRDLKKGSLNNPLS